MFHFNVLFILRRSQSPKDDKVTAIKSLVALICRNIFRSDVHISDEDN